MGVGKCQVGGGTQQVSGNSMHYWREDLENMPQEYRCVG